MPDLKQSLRDFVATSNSGKYDDEQVLLSKFPELQGYDIQLLRDFVTTSNSGKYTDEEELFSKFPEFNYETPELTPKKKGESTESGLDAFSSESLLGDFGQFDSQLPEQPIQPSLEDNGRKKLKQFEESQKYDRYGMPISTFPEVQREEVFTKPKQEAETKVKYEERKQELEKKVPGFLKPSVETIDKNFLSRKPSFVVDDLNRQYKESGFNFSGSDFYENVKVTAPNGKTLSMSTNAYLNNVEDEAERLKFFIKENSPSIGTEQIDRLQKEYDKGNQNFLTQKQLDEQTKQYNESAELLKKEIQDFLPETNAIQALKNQIESYPESQKNSPEYKSLVDNYNIKLGEYNVKSKALKTKIENSKQNEDNLKRAAGEYIKYKAQQGTFLGAMYNNMLKGIGSIANQYKEFATDRFFDITPLTVILGSEDYKKRFKEKEEQLSKEQNLPKGIVPLAKIVDEAIRDDLKKSQKYSIDSKGQAIPSQYIRDFFVKTFGTANTTEEYLKRIEEEGSIIQRGLLGFAGSIPAMVGNKYIRIANMYMLTTDAVAKEMENDPDFKNISENEKEKLKATIGVVGTALEELGFRNLIKGKSIIGNITKRILGKVPTGATASQIRSSALYEIKEMNLRGALALTGSTLAEAETGAAQQASEFLIKDIYNDMKDKKMFDTPVMFSVDYFNQIADAAATESVGGYFAGIPNSIHAAFTKDGFQGLDDDTFKMFEELSKMSDSKKFFVIDLKNKINEGKITKAEADNILEVYDKSAGLVQQIPDEITDVNDRKKAMDLLKERKRLEDKTQGKDPALTKPIQNQINNINEQLNAITENAIQKQDTEPSIGKKPMEIPQEISSLDDNEVVTFPVASLEDVPEEFRDRAKEIGGGEIETRQLIFGLPLGKKETVTAPKSYVYSLTGKEVKDYAIQKQAAGEVSVQPETGTGEEVVQGEPQPKPEAAPQQGVLSPEESQRKEELLAAFENPDQLLGEGMIKVNDTYEDKDDAQAELDALLQKEQATPEGLGTQLETAAKEQETFEQKKSEIEKITDPEQRKVAEIEFIMSNLMSGVGEASANKIKEYADRIISGKETRDKVIQGLPKSFVNGIDQLLAAQQLPTTEQQTAPVQPAETFTEQDKARQKELKDALAKADKRKKNITVGETVMPKADVKAELDALNQKELSSTKPEVTAPKVEVTPTETAPVTKTMTPQQEADLLEERLKQRKKERAAETKTEVKEEQKVTEKKETERKNKTKEEGVISEKPKTKKVNKSNTAETKKVDKEKPTINNIIPTSEETLSTAASLGGVAYELPGKIAIIQVFNLFGRPIYIGYKNGTYTRVDIDSFDNTNNVFTEKELNDLKNLKKEIQNQENKNQSDSKNPFTEQGRVAATDSVPNNIKKFVENLTKALGINKKIFIITDNDFNEGQYKKHGLFGTLAPIRSAILGSKNPFEFGAKRYMSDADAYYIYYDGNLKGSELFSVISHEIGHIVEQELFKNASKETIEAIKNDYNNWISKLTGKTLTEVQNETRDITIQHLLQGNVSMFDPSVHRYISSFSEYLADNVAKWARTSQKPKTLVDKFFSNLINEFKKIRDYVFKTGNYSENIFKWLDELYDIEAKGKEQGKEGTENEKTAKRIRDKKIKGALSAIDFGITQTVYNGSLEFMARQVEKGTKIGEAITATINWIDAKVGNIKWDKESFIKYINTKIEGGKNISKLKDVESTAKALEDINTFDQQDEKAEVVVGKEKDRWGRSQVWRERIENAGDILRELSGRGKNPDVKYLQEKINKLKNWVLNGEGFSALPKDIKTLKDVDESNVRFSSVIDGKEYLNKFHNDVLQETIDAYKGIVVKTQEEQIVKDFILTLLQGDKSSIYSKLRDVEDIVYKIEKQGELKSTPLNVSEAYHKAKADGSNPELVKAVEKLLGKESVTEKQKAETKKEKLSDKIRNLKLKGPGGLQSNILGVPIAIWNAAVETVASAIDAGTAIAEALKKGYNELKDYKRLNGKEYETEMLKSLYDDLIQEIKDPNSEFTKDGAKEYLIRQGLTENQANAVLEIKPKAEKKPISKEKIVGKPKPKKVTVNEMTALKDQIALEIKAAKDGAKSVADAIKAIVEYVKKMSNRGNLTRKDLIKILNIIPSVKDQGTLNKAANAIYDIIKNATTDIVEVSDYKAMISQIALEIRAAREAKGDLNTKRKMLAAAIKDMVKKGKITIRQAAVLINKVNNTNLDNPVMVERLLNYADKVFSNAEYAEKIARAKKLLTKAKENVRTKIGVSEGLTTLMNKLFNINPNLIPDDVLEAYLELVDMMGKRQAVLTLKESADLTKDVEKILDSINDELSTLDELIDIFEKYDDKVLDENGDIDFAATIEKMLEEGIITASDAKIYKKYKDKVLPEESKEKKTEAQIAEEKKNLIDAVQQTQVNENALLMREERDAARKLFEAITPSNLQSLTNTELKNLLKLLDNISNGFLPHYAVIMTQKLNASNRSKTLNDAVSKAGRLPLTKLIANIKALFPGAKTVNMIMVIESPKYVIDQVFGYFKTTPIYNSVFKPLTEAFASYKNDVKKAKEKLDKAFNKVANSYLNNPVKIKMSQFKMMTYALQLEYESNKDKGEGFYSAVDYIRETIKHARGKESTMSKKDIELLERILQVYGVKDADNKVVDIDINKLYNSLNNAEKEAIKTIQEVNMSIRDKAMFTSAVIRGDKMKPIDNYIHHNVLPTGITDTDLRSVSDDMNVKMMPSTRAKTLKERTKGAKPLDFNIFGATQRSANQVLMDFHLTEAVRTSRMVLNEARKELQEKGNDKDISILDAIESSFEKVLQNTLMNTFNESTFADKTISMITKQSYRILLASAKRWTAELISNLAYIGTVNPKAYLNGITKYSKYVMSEKGPAILRNINSGAQDRVYEDSVLSGRMIDNSMMNEAIGLSGTTSNYAIVNAMQVIHNNTTKKVQNFVATTADTLISTPDKISLRPFYFGVFAQNFKKETGQEVNFDKIAENDEAYLKKFKEAIDKSKEVADSQTMLAGGTKNPFAARQKAMSVKGAGAFTQIYQSFNNFMNSFIINEYIAARTGIYAMMGNGRVSQRQGAAMLAGVIARTTLYTLLIKEIGRGLSWLILGGDDEEDEEKSIIEKTGQAFAGSMTSLILGRDFGNLTRNMINYGVEKVNENYVQKMIDGQYSKDDVIAFNNLIPNSLSGKPNFSDLMINMSGAGQPFLRSLKTLYETTFADEAKREETIKKREIYWKYTLPLEVAGYLGFVPIYKDVKSVAGEVLKEEADAIIKEKEQKKIEKTEAYGGFKTIEELKIRDPEKYKELSKEGGALYELRKENKEKDKISEEKKEKYYKEEYGITIKKGSKSSSGRGGGREGEGRGGGREGEGRGGGR